MPVLSSAQVRLLSFCNRYPTWLSLDALRSARMLRDGDVDHVDWMVHSGLLARSPGRSYMITPAGRLSLEQVGQDVVHPDRAFREMIRDQLLGPDDE